VTRSQASVLWPVIKAWGEGESVQVRCLGNDWTDIPSDPTFSPDVGEWRVKPKPREFWVVVNPFTNEIIQTHNSDPQVCHKIHPATTYVVIHCIEVTTP
jgi:hypothetical protein